MATRGNQFPQQRRSGPADYCHQADLTHDGRTDLLLYDPDNQRHWLLTQATGQFDLHPLPDQCAGAARIIELTDGRSALVRGSCGDDGRLTHVWEDGRFVQIKE
jgi:hypothetical protein